MRLRAYAKINIGLQIVRKRNDGYHDIDTVFHRVDLFDQIDLTQEAAGITLTCSNPSLPLDERNLCYRAAERAFARSGYEGGVRIHIEKIIPMGGGLGGGSSDAATTLLGLRTILNLPLSDADLFDIALSIGSDVPYFLEQGSAYAKGRGELLSYFHLDLPYWIVLVCPDIHVSTAWAYGAFTFNPLLPIIDLRKTLLDHLRTPAYLVNAVRNDFEPAVFHEHEELLRIKEILYRTGADFALMSGSGSSMFGLFSDERYAQDCAAFFAKTYRVFVSSPGFSPEG